MINIKFDHYKPLRDKFFDNLWIVGYSIALIAIGYALDKILMMVFE